MKKTLEFKEAIKIGEKQLSKLSLEPPNHSRSSLSNNPKEDEEDDSKSSSSSFKEISLTNFELDTIFDANEILIPLPEDILEEVNK